jgi:hypothetical protein
MLVIDVASSPLGLDSTGTRYALGQLGTYRHYALSLPLRMHLAFGVRTTYQGFQGLFYPS